MMLKNSFMKTGLIFLVFILFIGLSSNHGFSSQVPIEKRIDRVLVANPQFMDSSDCSMWIDNMTVHPGETYDIPVHGSWSFIISAYHIGLHYNPDIIEIVDVQWATTCAEDAYVRHYIIPTPGVLSILVAYFPGDYQPPNSGPLAKIVLQIAEDAESGECILDLGIFGGDPPVECAYANEYSQLHYPEIYDGILTIFRPECGDVNGDGTGPDIADLVYLVDYICS